MPKTVTCRTPGCGAEFETGGRRGRPPVRCAPCRDEAKAIVAARKAAKQTGDEQTGSE
jgi:hypothetical protein